jgi:ankyrin repeat protein
MLRSCFARNLRRTLDELPETLDETYNRILREIPEKNREDTHRLLQCLTVAVRPLRVEELVEVLAMDFTGEIPVLNADSRWEDQEEAVLLACSSLIAIGETNGLRVVQFSHFSVKEFLISGRLATPKRDVSHYHIRPEAAHTVMARACLAVLLRLDYSIDKERIKGFPLANYAGRHFSDHAEFENVLTHIQAGADCLLDAEKPHFAAWLWVREMFFCGRPEPPKALPLYYVTEFGFRGLVQHIISKHPQDVNTSTGGYGTPLHAASYYGRIEVGQLLLDRGADINARQNKGMTPLHLAMRCRHVDFARMLLEHNAAVDARDDDHSTPLHMAESNAAQLLLKCGANVNARNKGGQTPLHSASQRGSGDTMRLLLDRGADVDARDDDHSTPLHLALFEATHTVQAQASEPGLALQSAMASGRTARRDREREWKQKRERGREPARAALAALLLLECGANVHIRNKNGQTPLHYASLAGCSIMVQLLLELGAGVDSRDGNHSTPLHLALFELTRAVQAQARASESGLALSSMASEQAALLLLEHGANVHVQNKDGQTPLHYIEQ